MRGQLRQCSDGWKWLFVVHELYDIGSCRTFRCHYRHAQQLHQLYRGINRNRVKRSCALYVRLDKFPECERGHVFDYRLTLSWKLYGYCHRQPVVHGDCFG